MSDLHNTKVVATPAQAPVVAMVYIRDRDSEAIVRQCLSNLAAGAVSFISAGVEAAISDLAHRSSPRLLVVDISGTGDPVARINELAQVCEPNTGVIVIGDVNDVVLYRGLKGAGVVEYYFKPLVSNLVSQTCAAILAGDAQHRTARMGKLVFVMGVKGGVGATSIATWVAWHLAESSHRRVLLLDLDLSAGDAALQFDVTPNHTLCEALEQPDRVDNLFIERGVIHVTPRLDLLASLEPLDKIAAFSEDALSSLLTNLLSRYRYVFVDLPASLAPQLARVLQQPSTCILVSDASLVAARDVARWCLKLGTNTAERTTLHVVNKAGAHGSLPFDAFARALGRAPDIIIPYQREIGLSSTLGVKDLPKDGALAHALAPVLRYIAGEEVVEEHHSLLSRLLG